MKTSADIRSAFSRFFAGKGHEVVESSPLVPGNDPTLLFTNAAWVQFKDVFLAGQAQLCPRGEFQRCVRRRKAQRSGMSAIPRVTIPSSRMLGNFSFGDYFKREAIQYAWDFLTGVLGLPPEKLCG